MTYFSLKKSGTDDVLFEGDYASLINCVESAIEQRVCLDHVNLRGANLVNAELDEGSFRFARFDHANLTGTNLSGAKLQKACFKNATLYNTCLCEAVLNEAQFFGATFGGVDIAWADMTAACFDTLSALDLDFSDAIIMKDALFYDRTGVICNMSHAPMIIKGLQYPIMLFDDHMKVGSAVMSFGAWQSIKNNMNLSGLDHDLLMFIKVYGAFLFTLAEIRGRHSKDIVRNNHKNVA